MSDKEKEPFLGFDDNSRCPKNYWKYTEHCVPESSERSKRKFEKPVTNKQKSYSKEPVKQAAQQKKKFVSCRQCEGCKRVPCGECVYCIDKIYQGNKRKKRCLMRKCVLKSPKHQKVLQVKEELTEEDATSSEDDDENYEDDILDQMLNKLLHEGAHKEALFKDLLVYKYWKLRPEPSPEELVSLAKLLNMTMEGIQQILTNSKSDLLSIVPKTSQGVESSVDSRTARKKIMDILKKYPKDAISDINKSKTLKLEIKRSTAERTPLHEDMAQLKKLIGSDIRGYTHHTLGLFVSVPIWLEGLHLFLTKADLSPLSESRGLRMPKIRKMTQALVSGELPETLVQCLVDHGLNCPKYMNLTFHTLTSWAKHLHTKKLDEKHQKTTTAAVAATTSQPTLSADEIKIKKEPVETTEKQAESPSPETEVKPETTTKTITSNSASEVSIRSADYSTPSSSSSAHTRLSSVITTAPEERADLPKCEKNADDESQAVVECESAAGNGAQSEAADGATATKKDESSLNKDCTKSSTDIESVENEMETEDNGISDKKHEIECKEINSKSGSESKEKEACSVKSDDGEMADEDTEDAKEECDSKPDTEKRSRRYMGTVGKRGKAQTKKQSKKEQSYDKLDGGLVVLPWRETSIEQVWTEGYLIPTTEYGSSCPELCYLCGSAGLAGFIYCFACAEPFHKYCLDIDDNEVISADWRCERCIMCQVCNRTNDQMLLKCCECYHTYHAKCLPPDTCGVPSRNGIWKCHRCLFCRKCGAKGNSETKWVYDFSVCRPCGKLYSKGNYCPLCEAVYEDEDYDTPMVSCMSCEHWVHIECDNITELEYEAMSNLPEDRVVYVCRRCCRDNVWRQEMIQCIQENLAHCLEAMEGVLDRSKIRLHKYNTVKSIRLFENDVFQYIASTPGAVGTFRAVLKECFPWYSKVKKGIFDAKTPVKTPKKIHWFNKTFTNTKVPQNYESSWFVEKDDRKCVLCTQTGDLAGRGCGRLVMCGVDNWVHVNCALWSSEVYEDSDGKLMNVEMAINRGSSLRCDHCGIYNATVGCCDKQCPRSFHFNCGIKSGAVFLSDKRLFCKHHKEKHRKPHWEHMEQHDFSISRRIYIDPAKIGGTKRNTRPINSSSLIPYVGASRITRLGDVMNISDHPDILIPIGYTLERLFWSFRDPSYRCRYRCTVVPQVPDNPDLFFTGLSDVLLSRDMPFTDWVERATGTFKRNGETVFELTLTIQRPQLNSFNSDSFADKKDNILTPAKAAAKTPVKVRAKIRQAREEPLINLDGVKVKKSRVRKPKDDEGVLGRPKVISDPGDVHRIKRIHKKEDANNCIASKVRDDTARREAKQRDQRRMLVDTELARARQAALDIQRKRLLEEERLRVRRYSRLDHTYSVPHRTMDSPRPVLEYEKHLEPLRVRPGYYIDCISANEGIKSLLQRVGGDDSLRCCGIPYLDPKVVFMYEDEKGKRCIKMAPPATPRKSPDHDFDSELPNKGRKMKSVLYKYNKKKKPGNSSVYLHKKSQRPEVKHCQQGTSMYNNSQFKSRVIQQIRAYNVCGDKNVIAISRADTTTPATATYRRIYAQLPTTTIKQLSPTDVLKKQRYVPTTTLQCSVQSTTTTAAVRSAVRFTPPPGLAVNQLTVFSTTGTTPHFRVISAQKKSMSPRKSPIAAKELVSPRKTVTPISDYQRTSVHRTPAEGHARPHSSGMTSPVKLMTSSTSSASSFVLSDSHSFTKDVKTPALLSTQQSTELASQIPSPTPSSETRTEFQVPSDGHDVLVEHESAILNDQVPEHSPGVTKGSPSKPSSQTESVLFNLLAAAESIMAEPPYHRSIRTYLMSFAPHVVKPVAPHVTSLSHVTSLPHVTSLSHVTASPHKSCGITSHSWHHGLQAVLSTSVENVLKKVNVRPKSKGRAVPLVIDTDRRCAERSDAKHRDTAKDVEDTSSVAMSTNPIMIKNTNGNKNKSTASVMSVGTGTVQSARSDVVPAPRPPTNSPARKKCRSQFDVFDFDLFDEKAEDGRYKCLSDHYNILKRDRPKKPTRKEAEEWNRSSNSSSNISLKLSTSAKPSWIFEGDKPKSRYETIDVDSWLTQREEEQKAKKLLEDKFSFDLCTHEDEISHKITKQSGFVYTGCGGVIKDVPVRTQLADHLKSLPPQPEPKPRHDPSSEIDQFSKLRTYDRLQLLNEFDAALQKYTRRTPPDTLTLKESDEKDTKIDPMPMDISPTLLPSYKEDIPTQKTALPKPNILSKLNATSISVDKPRSGPLFPGVGVASFDHAVGGVKRRVKQTVESKSTTSVPSGNIKISISRGDESALPVKELKIKPTSVVQSNNRSVAEIKEVYKVIEGKKTYKMSSSLKELQPKALRKNPPKSPSPVKELLKDFILEREIKRTLNFDMEAWKSKVNEITKPSPLPLPKPLLDKQNQKIVDSFSSYDPPKFAPTKPASFAETLKSGTVEDFTGVTRSPSSTNPQQSLLAELNSTSLGEAPDHRPTITVLQSGYQASPGKVSLQDTANILSTSMELYETYPEPPSKQLRPVQGRMSYGVKARGERPPLVSSTEAVVQPATKENTPVLYFKDEVTEPSKVADPDVKCQSGAAAKELVHTSFEEFKPSSILSNPQMVYYNISTPDKNICSRHLRNEFLSFKSMFVTKIKPEVKDAPSGSGTLPDTKLTSTIKDRTPVNSVKEEVKVEKEEESPPSSRTKRKSAIIASRNLVEKVYKDEDIDDDLFERKNKRRCDRPSTMQSPSPNKHSSIKTLTKLRSTSSNTVKLKLQITQSNNRTYIRCRSKERDPSEKCFPVFIVATEDGVYVETDDADDSWTIISTLIQRIRSTKHQSVLHGLAMWTLAHDSVIHVIEQLPNTHKLEEYSFHFPEHGPQRARMNIVLPMPPGGCARTMPVVRKPYIDQFAFLNHPYRSIKPPSIDDSKLAVAVGDSVNLYNRRTTSMGDLPMAMRYRHIMTTVKEVLCVCPSVIHGRGLYCMQDMTMSEMIVEYSGTLIRPGLCDIREKYYDSKGIGSYMFRIDAHEVVDATMSGSMARFINHSCDPNCYSRIINVEGKKKIIIFAERNIVRGEELTYDYKFPSEDIKIPCLCGSEKCRKWMN